MQLPRLHPFTRACLVALLFAQQSAFALLNIDGTKNQVFVFGQVSFAYDSNIFSSAGGDGDTVVNASFGTEVKRRAGILSVNARATMTYQGFKTYTDQNAWDPSFYMEINKTTGRTTGAFTVNAYRSSRADSAVNIRTQSWNFPLGLNVKYPINDNLYVTSSTGYLKRSFADSTAGLLSYTDYSEALDFFYVYSSRMDLLGGYRIRVGSTELGSTTDHSLTIGATNEILPKLNGTVRFGYQWRAVDSTGESYRQLTASAALTWNATRKFTGTISLNRDFTTTAVGGTVDTLSAMLRGRYDFTRKYSAEAGVGYGRNTFLGGTPRRDEFFNWDVGARVHWSEHLEISAAYTYMINWSTISLSDFTRTGYSINISSRY